LKTSAGVCFAVVNGYKKEVGRYKGRKGGREREERRRRERWRSGGEVIMHYRNMTNTCP